MGYLTKPAGRWTRSASATKEDGDQATEQLAVATSDGAGGPSRQRRHKAFWLISAAVVLVATAITVAVTAPFASGGAGRPGTAGGSQATGTYVVARQDLSSQTQVAATLGYSGSYTIAVPSGTSAEQVDQAQQAVVADQQALSADEQAAADTAVADNQQIATAQSSVNEDQSALSADEAKEAQDCAGPAASSPTCSRDTQKVSQDQAALTQSTQQLATAGASSTSNTAQDQAKVAADQLKLRGDQATLTSLQASAVNPGTTFTSLPAPGAVITEDQPVYSVNDEPVPLLYGSIPAYRVFSAGMSDGADVGQLTEDLISLGYGDGLAQSNHFSTATTAAVKRWQSALGLPTTGEILLGQVVFEPGPIRVTSVVPSVGTSVAGGGGGSGSGATVLTATSTTRQVSIALDTSQQAQVAVGDKVSITLPNNQTTPGVITTVGTVATTPSSNANNGSGSSNPTVAVLVKPTDPTGMGTWGQAPVTVTITTGSVTHVLVVPVDALLAQVGGRYALQVVGAHGTYHLVGVTLGLFDDADGLVQVSGVGLTSGQHVVVPRL